MNSTQPPTPDAQLKLVSKVFPEKNHAAVLIQTDSHTKLWMATELAVDQGLTTLNFLTVAVMVKSKPTVKKFKNALNLINVQCFY